MVSRSFRWLGAVLLVAMAFSAQASDSVKLSFKESFREETETISESGGFSSSTETRSASKSKFTVDVDIPMSDVDWKKLDSRTRLIVSVGSFSLRGDFNDDPGYVAGNSMLTIRDHAPDENPDNRLVAAQAKVQYRHGHVLVHIDSGSGPATIAARTAQKELPNIDIKGESVVRIRLGDVKWEFTAIFTGHKKVLVRGTNEHNGKVETIELKGEGRGSDPRPIEGKTIPSTSTVLVKG